MPRSSQSNIDTNKPPEQLNEGFVSVHYCCGQQVYTGSGF